MNFLTKLILPAPIALSLAAPLLPAQVRRPPFGTPGNVGPVIDAVATFDGVFKAADKKFVLIQVESGDVMRMYITHGTKFVRDGKTVKPSEFHEGDKVVADATRDARLNLLAVKVEIRKDKEEIRKDKDKDGDKAVK